MKQKTIGVIGGGLGGLSAAISLAHNPAHKVILLEKNAHLGGKLNVVSKDGFTFDLGPSILTMPHLFEQLFAMHNRKMADYVAIEPVRPHWRNFFEDGKIVDLTADPGEMTGEPSCLTDEEVEELRGFLRYSQQLYQFSDQTYFQNQSEKTLDVLKYYNPLKILRDCDFFSTMDDGVRKRIHNPYLIDILNYFAKYVGSSPYDAPAILNLLPYIQWEFDLWYVQGGMYNLARGLERLIHDLGIEVRKDTEVTEMQREGDVITALVLQDGSKVVVDLVVSNMEVIPFYERISREPNARIEPYRKKYGPACSGFALHLGVNRQYDILRHHNFFYSKNPQKQFHSIFHAKTLYDDPCIYLVAPMKTDPAQGPEGCEVIKILPHIPVLDKDTPFTDHDYAQYKEAVLSKLERMGLEGLRASIVTEELWTPATIQAHYYSNQGAIYGIVSDKKKNKGFKTPKHSAFYHNLYFVGGSVNPGGGMPMVVLSGQQVVDQIYQNKRFMAL